MFDKRETTSMTLFVAGVDEIDINITIAERQSACSSRTIAIVANTIFCYSCGGFKNHVQMMFESIYIPSLRAK